MTYFVMPHYIASAELEQLAINAIVSMRQTADVFIVSVDDGSPLSTWFLEDISDFTIHIEKNSGFAKACNLGLQWCIDQGADLIGCANNDIEVFDGWLRALEYPFTQWDDVGVTGLISSKERTLNSHPVEKYQVPKITEGGLLNHWMQSGGLWLSRSSVLKQVGLFDERFKVGGEEDVDLFWRMFESGYKLVMSGYSCFWHKEGATRWREGAKEKNKAIEQKNYEKFKEKWGWDIRTDGLRFTENILEENGVKK